MEHREKHCGFRIAKLEARSQETGARRQRTDDRRQKIQLNGLNELIKGQTRRVASEQ